MTWATSFEKLYYAGKWVAGGPIASPPFTSTFTVSAPTAVVVGGVVVSAEQLKAAIAALVAYPGAQVKPALKAIGSPLADIDHHAIAAAEMAKDPSLRKGKTKTKNAVVYHLSKQLLPPFSTVIDLGSVEAKPATATVSAYQHLVDTDMPPVSWPENARRQYCADHNLKPSASPCCWRLEDGCGTASVAARAIDEHLAAERARRKREAEALPVFSYADPQPQLSGYHRKMVLVDQHGRRWLFKPAPHAKAFRAEAEHGAHLLARAWGFPTAESRLVTFDGMYGQVQRMFVEQANFADVSAAGFAAYTVDQLAAVACEHLLDWAIDNDDCKGDNLLITDTGQVVGVDKARAWVYFGGWDGLSSHDSANSNAPLVYTELYRAIKNGVLARDTVDRIYRAVRWKARRMAHLADADLADILAAAVANRPHFNPPSYRSPIDGAPTSADELIAAAIARKNALPTDMRALWERVYAGAGWELPDDDCLGLNAQGHPLHTGLHQPALHAAVARSKSYGTATFVAGTDIEDAHILLWREKAGTAVRVRGQCKTRGGAFERVKAWCEKHAVTVDKPLPEPSPLPGEARWYAAIIDAAKTVSFHAEDGQYNADKLAEFAAARTEMVEARRAAEQAVGAVGDAAGRRRAIIECTTLYLAFCQIIDVHRTNRTSSSEGDFPRYVYTPAPPAERVLRVELRPATRAAAGTGNRVVLAGDGELVLDEGSVLTSAGDRHCGQPGDMYLVTLPTGETIEFRADDSTNTPLSTQGLTQFTIPDEATIAPSLRRIDDQLADMGLFIEPADRDDLELFYWRHLAAIMADRRDSHPGKKGQPECYATFWSRAVTQPLPRQAERQRWRHAFSALSTPAHIEAFLAADGHLPRFMHMDLRNPQLPCGKPYWERFDVPVADALARKMPYLHYRNGPRWVLATGVCMATEARIRTFAIWKAGISSTEDMGKGSAGFVFTRQNLEGVMDDEHLPSVYFNPRVLLRTSNYAFPGDMFGAIRYRKCDAPFDFQTMTSFNSGGNELLVKDAMSLLDDIELLIFDDPGEREAGIADLARLGITDIRGIPVSVRLVYRGDWKAVEAAKQAVRMSLSHGSEPGQ